MEHAVAGSFGRPIVCPVLIGRDAAVAALHRLIDGGEADRCRMALIAGEAGLGKSRLAAEAKGYAAAHGFVVLEGACFPQDRTCPYAMLLDLLRGRFAGHEAETVTAAIGPFARELFPLLPDLIPRPAEPLPALEPEQERRQLFAALAHSLVGGSADQPVLVVVEDLHWCDDGSLDFLLYLARHAAGRPRLILGTYRAEDADPRLRHWLAELDREHLAHELALAPLAREEVASMLGAIFGADDPPPGGLLDTTYALSEGNPFYVEELLKALVEAGDLGVAKVARTAHFGPVDRWRIPRSLHDAVQQRVARLSLAAREVLTVAAVVGRRFDFELLQHLAQVDERTLLGLIKEMIEAQLVVEESPDRFAFRHALTRQATTAELLARERVALHRTVAEAAEQLYAASLDQRLDDLAYHSYEAGAWDKALAYAQRAGERAQRLYVPRAAVEHFTRALGAAEHLPRAPGLAAAPLPASTLAGLHRERGRAAETLGDFAQALADYEAALELARGANDRPAEWQGLLDLGTLWTGRDYEQAGAWYGRALELARVLGEPALLAHSLNRVGNWRVNTAQPREALPLHHEALSIFEGLGDRGGVAWTLDLLGMASLLSADLPGGVASYERAVALFHELDDRPGLVSSLATLSGRGGSYELGSMTTDAADFAAGVRDGERALELARAIDWRAGEAFARCQLAVVVGPLGEYGRALQLAQGGLRIAEEIEHLQWMAGAHCALGEVYLDLLALSEARHHLERALELAREVRSAFWVQVATGCLAWAYVLDGDFGRASATLGAVPEGEAPVQSLGERWVVYGHLQLALARRDSALALRLVNRVSAPTLDGTSTSDTPRPALARGEALTGLGQYAEAEAVLRAAQDVTSRQGARPLLWRGHVLLGSLYRAQQRPDEAQREFSSARAIIEDLASNVPDEGLRDEFLRNATARLPRPYRLSPRRVAAARHGGLTAREREVAQLVAQGSTNREIADVLVLGERTVETHVSHVLAKLGLDSRREIARWAADKGLSDDAP